jgi:hypothetical protein
MHSCLINELNNIVLQKNKPHWIKHEHRTPLPISARTVTTPTGVSNCVWHRRPIISMLRPTLASWHR